MNYTNFGRFRWYEKLPCWKCGADTRRKVYDSYQHTLSSHCETCNSSWDWDYEKQEWIERQPEVPDNLPDKIELTDDDLPF